MRWLLGAALLALALVAAATEAPGIRVLSSGRAHGLEGVLRDALRIYTRDLGRTVRMGGSAPASLEAEALARVAAEAQAAGDEVVVWFGERAGAPVLFALRVPAGELRETPVGVDEPAEAARALALKVRALIARRETPGWVVAAEGARVVADGGAEAEGETGDRRQATGDGQRVGADGGAPGEMADDGGIAPAATGNAAPAAKANAAATAGSAATGAGEAATGEAVRRAGGKERRVWLEATAAYQATVPTTPEWTRHGLLVRLAVPLGRVPLQAFVDAAFGSEPARALDGSTVRARVWPVGLGLAARLERPRFRLALGPRASLQIADASARAPDGRSGAARRYSAGLGLAGEAAWRFSRWVGAIASVGAEALVPRLQFHAGTPATTDLGWVQLTFAAGLLFSIP